MGTKATRSNTTSVDTTLAANITATQDYIPVASTTNFSTSVVAEIETTNEVVSFGTISENIFTNSQDFNVSWSAANSSVGANTTVAPDGTTTAETLTFTTTGYGSVFKTETVVAGQPYTFSVFAKAGVTNILSLEQRLGNSVGVDVSTFNLSTGAVISAGDADSTSITDEGNGWFRCSTTTNSSPDTSETFIIGRGTSGSVNDTIFIWGAQLEKALTTTPYLPTSSASLVGLTTVTRGVNGTTAASASSGASIQQLPFALTGLDIPIRLKGLTISSDGSGAGRLTLCDNNGDTLCDVDVPDNRLFELSFGGGVLFPNGIFVSNTIKITAYTLYTDFGGTL